MLANSIMRVHEH